MLCLNLCELYHGQILSDEDLVSFFNYIVFKKKQPIERVYIGSSFCSQYFLRFSGYEQIFKLCQQTRIPVTLTVPVFSEKDLDAGKERINQLCIIGAENIDEITVNDIGMLFYFQNQSRYRINLGRLFFKDPRDCRVPEYTEKEIEPFLLTQLKDTYWKNMNINFIELDPTNQRIRTLCLEDTDIEIGIHTPYCYMTTGNICKYASVHHNIEKKFRPNSKCGMECFHVSEVYSGHVSATACDPMIYRFGRTLYFEADSVVLVGKTASRDILFPIQEWREFSNENFSSIK